MLATDKIRDLAIIKIHGKTFPALTLGNSDQIQVGEEVVAIGNPLGLELTVSNGILSGVRQTKEEGTFLQTTAPISHGSSGGPLFNMSGEVIGINTLYLEGGENLNFAIPVNDAKRLLLNQSAKLQALPNEAEPEEIQPKEAPAEGDAGNEQATSPKCDRLSEKFARYERQAFTQSGDFRNGHASHYDAKANKCYVENVFPLLSSGESIYEIDDAFFERHWRSAIRIVPIGRDNVRRV